MMLAASANATMVSFGMAEGRPNSALIAQVSKSLSAFVLAALLTKPIGETGVGLALTVSTLAATIVLAVGAHPLVQPLAACA